VARRKDINRFDLWLDRVASLPWWAWSGIAVVTYALGHRHVGWDLVGSAPLGHEGAPGAALGWRSFASLAASLLALACVAGAATSALRRRVSRGRPIDAKLEDAADAIEGMTRRDFEALVAQAFRLQGYHVTETGGGGVDMVLRKDRQTFLVDCKQWQAAKVGVEVVESLSQVVTARGAAGAFVVTSGRFSREATTFASLQNLRLIDGPVLQTLIQRAHGARAGVTQAQTNR
jgi:restriction system protein